MLSVFVLCKSYTSSADRSVSVIMMRAGACSTCSGIIASSVNTIIYAPVAFNSVELVADSGSRWLICIASYSKGITSSGSGVHIVTPSTLSVRHKGILRTFACSDAIVTWRNWQRLHGINFS